MTSLPAKGNMYIDACHAAKVQWIKSSYLIVLLFALLKLQAQVSVHYCFEDTTSSHTYDTIFRNDMQANLYLRSLRSQLQLEGYINASLDTVEKNGAEWIAHIFLGQRYKWKALYSNDRRDTTIADLRSYIGHLLDQHANTGYPLAQMYIDSLQLNGSEASGVLRIDKGALNNILSVRILGKPILTSEVLQRMIGIKEGTGYDQQKIRSIGDRIERSGIVSLGAPANVEILNTGTVITVDLRPLKVNRMNALIGLVQDPISRRSRITGDAQLYLKNSFGKAETISFNWQQFTPSSPQLQLSFDLPYILGSKFGASVTAEMLKKDSSFVNIDMKITGQYRLNDKMISHMGLHKFSSVLSAIDTQAVIRSGKLPSIHDIEQFGLTAKFQYDDRKTRSLSAYGSWFELFLDVGSRKIKKNNKIMSISTIDAERLYDTVQLFQPKTIINVEIMRSMRLTGESILRTGLHTAAVLASSVHENEFFRIGGPEWLRGVDDRTILARSYAIASLEYRYMLNASSCFNVFADGGIAKAWSATKYISAGTGLLLGNDKGQLQIQYAVGNMAERPFTLKRSKLHIGFMTTF